MDTLLVTLIKVARDKGFERLRKIEMGKNSHRICEVNKRHKRALALSPDSIKVLEHNKWMVTSQTMPNTTYIVKLVAAVVAMYDAQSAGFVPMYMFRFNLALNSLQA